MRLISALICVLPLFLAHGNAYAEGGKIIKWVDEKGVTHYGDSMPAQEAGRGNSVINAQGRVVQRNQPFQPQAKTSAAENPDKEAMEQQRRDRTLRAAYTTENEIDLARDRNLQMDEAALEGLKQHLGATQSQLEANKKLAEGFNNRKKPLPPDLTQYLKNNQAEIASIEAQITQRRASMDATRQRYDNDKRRFVELKSGSPNTP
ncbi:MAG: DUF4124 domain-containing protein [Methylophilaceae bacterium]